MQPIKQQAKKIPVIITSDQLFFDELRENYRAVSNKSIYKDVFQTFINTILEFLQDDVIAKN